MSREDDGPVRLFPLPNLVLFPSVVQPLHIFEPRYRQMTADALAHDRQIALVLLRPGWEDDYLGRPPLHDVACLGRIVADQRLEDGRYNLVLRGLDRVRIVEELEDDCPYRTARVAALEETPADAAVGATVRLMLRDLLPRWLAEPAREQFLRLLDHDLPCGALGDIIAFSLPLPPPFKQELLEELDVGRRLALLLRHLEGTAPRPLIPPPQRTFPPPFSDN